MPKKTTIDRGEISVQEKWVNTDDDGSVCAGYSVGPGAEEAVRLWQERHGGKVFRIIEVWIES